MKQALSNVLICALIYALTASGFAQNTPNGPAQESRAVGTFYAPGYAYGINPGIAGAHIKSGNSTTGSSTITLYQGFVTLGDGRTITPFSVYAPISVVDAGGVDTVTPTAVSNCQLNYQPDTSSGLTCTITASFANIHGQGALVTSGTFGLQEAINDAYANGGGIVTVDSAWSSQGGTDTILNAAIPFASVSINDIRKNAPQTWSSMPSTTTLLAAGTTLTPQAACDSTHQFCSDANVAGSASWATAVYGCYTLVDINGNESPCSTTQNFVPVASKAIDMGVSLTARTDNVVGWKPYLSVANGSYALAYSVPLLTQPTTLLAVPVSAGVCTLTTLETTTPACAIANSVYGQAGSTTGSIGKTKICSGKKA